MRTNSHFSTNVYQIKHCTRKEKSVQEESTVKSVSQDWLLLMRMVRGYRCLSLERLINQDVLKALEIYRVLIELKASWMTAELFEERVRQLDRKFSAANRNIVLITDNCTTDLHVEQLNSIELIFLPPNTTSHTQLMEKKNPVPTTSILSAITMLERRGMLFRTKLSLIASIKLVSLRKKWKKCLMTKMTPLLA